MAEKPGSSPPASRPPESAGQKNEGEGNKTAARQYNKGTRDFVKSGRVDTAAEAAAKAVSGEERHELEQAEEKGRRHAKE